MRTSYRGRWRRCVALPSPAYVRLAKVTLLSAWMVIA